MGGLEKEKPGRGMRLQADKEVPKQINHFPGEI